MSDVVSLLQNTTIQNCLEYAIPKAEKLGFEYCAVGWCVPVPVTRPKAIITSNFPDSWQQHYQASCYVSVDPTLTHGMRSSSLGVWNSRFFEGAADLWKDAQQHGLCHGLVQARHEPGGSYSLIVLARTDTAIGPAELERKEADVLVLSHRMHARIRRSREVHTVLDNGITLTPREVEVLRWTADGKTAADIATFLGVSERTINLNLSTAANKLNASNKTSATVRAAMLGLLW